MAASHQDGQRPLWLLSLGSDIHHILQCYQGLIMIYDPDGGGIRGLSPILILKEIMRQINQGRPTDHQLQPWQVFDLIGGTSTGG